MSAIRPSARRGVPAPPPLRGAGQLIGRVVAGDQGLSRADLYLVLVAPVGDAQEPLAVATDAWRTDFVTHLGTALGAQVFPPVRSDSTGRAWTKSSTVPPVVIRGSRATCTGCGAR